MKTALFANQTLTSFPPDCTRGLQGLSFGSAFEMFITFSDSSINIGKGVGACNSLLTFGNEFVLFIDIPNDQT